LHEFHFFFSERLRSMRPRDFDISWHSPSNAHTYRLLVFKELALRHYLSVVAVSCVVLQLSAERAILTCFI